MLGVLLMAILSISLILIGIPTYWTRVFTGAFIIVGTGVTAWQVSSTRRRAPAAARAPSAQPPQAE